MGFQLGLRGNNPPCHKITDEKRENSGCKCKNNGHEADNRRIDIEVLTDPATNSGNLLISFRTIEFLHGLFLRYFGNIAEKRLLFKRQAKKIRRSVEGGGLFIEQ